jgi:hypothetical protein
MSDDFLDILNDNTAKERPKEESHAQSSGGEKKSKDDRWDAFFNGREIEVNSLDRSCKAYIASGDRDIPRDIEDMFTDIAKKMSDLGFVLRYGASDRDGVEKAAARGAGDNVELYLPWNKFAGMTSDNSKPSVEAYDISAKYHKAFNKLPAAARAFVARSTQAFLGADNKSPIKFLLTYTKDGVEDVRKITAKTGNVGHLIRLCDAIDIPVFNLKNPESKSGFASFIKSITS